MSSGNQGFISRYDEQMTNYSVNIGNINPKQKIKLKTIFIQMIGSQESKNRNIINNNFYFNYEL